MNKRKAPSNNVLIEVTADAGQLFTSIEEMQLDLSAMGFIPDSNTTPVLAGLPDDSGIAKALEKQKQEVYLVTGSLNEQDHQALLTHPRVLAIHTKTPKA